MEEMRREMEEMRRSRKERESLVAEIENAHIMMRELSNTLDGIARAIQSPHVAHLTLTHHPSSGIERVVKYLGHLKGRLDRFTGDSPGGEQGDDAQEG